MRRPAGREQSRLTPALVMHPTKSGSANTQSAPMTESPITGGARGAPRARSRCGAGDVRRHGNAVANRRSACGGDRASAPVLKEFFPQLRSARHELSTQWHPVAPRGRCLDRPADRAVRAARLRPARPVPAGGDPARQPERDRRAVVLRLARATAGGRARGLPGGTRRWALDADALTEGDQRSGELGRPRRIGSAAGDDGRGYGDRPGATDGTGSGAVVRWPGDQPAAQRASSRGANDLRQRSPNRERPSPAACIDRHPPGPSAALESPAMRLGLNWSVHHP